MDSTGSQSAAPEPATASLPAPVHVPRAPQPQPARRVIGAGTRVLSTFVVIVTGLSIFGFIGLLSRKNPDPGIRIWMLNHTPDQALIINPFDGVVEKSFQVADGLRELAFSRDYTKAYVLNVVDVSNRLTVMDTRTALKDETIEVDGVPQGIGVFPDNRRIAVVLGSKTDFMAGGFDVLDLAKQSKADPKRKERLWRVRDLQLTHKIAVGDDGDRIYLIDAKAPLVSVYSFSRKEKVKEIDLHGAPEEMLYPPGGKYFYVSVLAHSAIYQIDKRTDEVNAVYIYSIPELDKPYAKRKLRYMAVDSKGERLYATNYEDKTLAVWEIGNPETMRDWHAIPFDPSNGRTYLFQLNHFLPKNVIRLKGGYNPNVAYIPGGKQVMLDSEDEYVFIVDDDGALYIYDNKVVLQAEIGSTPEPRRIVPIEVDAVEIRDMKVCRPPVRFGIPRPKKDEAAAPAAGAQLAAEAQERGGEGPNG